LRARHRRAASDPAQREDDKEQDSNRRTPHPI
jgi:hypothetical protein